MRPVRSHVRGMQPWVGALVLVSFAVAGCGYTIRAPFNPAVQTVYVPIFKSTSFRRDVNLQLTELVQKEIERRSGYKVVGRPEDADTTLDGTIVIADKNVRTMSPNNYPRELMTMMTIQVRWIDNRITDPVAREQTPPVVVMENVPFFPEVGETSSLAFQRTLQRIAQDIVNMMEEPW